LLLNSQPKTSRPALTGEILVESLTLKTRDTVDHAGPLLLPQPWNKLTGELPRNSSTSPNLNSLIAILPTTVDAMEVMFNTLMNMPKRIQSNFLRTTHTLPPIENALMIDQRERFLSLLTLTLKLTPLINSRLP